MRGGGAEAATAVDDPEGVIAIGRGTLADGAAGG